MGKPIKYRFTYYGQNGTIYSVIGYYNEECKISLGEWVSPFPNNENESTAFGLLESLGQSDDYPPVFYTEEIVKIKVVMISDNCKTI